jgi:glycosyltransferase involved in cell wall biosynthesis
VDSELFSPPPDRQRGDIPHILCIGRLTPFKGHQVLLEALALLRDRGYPFRATIAGGGPAEDQVQRSCRELGLEQVVNLPGAVGQDDIRALYASASIFCMPSFAEGLPGVIFEAMAMELPVVSTWIAGVPELVIEAETGYLVPPARAPELAQAIARLIEDPQHASAMGRAGRAKVIREYGPAQLAERLCALFPPSPQAPSPSRRPGRLR